MNILKKTKGWKLPLIAVVGLIFALVTVLSRQPAPAKEPLVMPPTSNFENSISGIGIIEPKSEIINIGSEVSGIVRTVHVKVGDSVKAADRLFTIDERAIDAQIKTLEATLLAAQTSALESAAQFAIVQSIGNKGAVSKEDFIRRKYASQLDQARVTEAEARLIESKTTKDRMTVTSPIDGKILSVDIRAGEYAVSGMVTTPLIRMGNTSTLHVRVEIDEENASQVMNHAPADAVKRDNDRARLPLTFVRFEPYITPKQNLAVAGQRVDTRVLQVIYSIDSPIPSLFIGEQMDIFIEKKGNEK